MPTIPAAKLRTYVTSIFNAAGCNPPEDEQVARRLVESNLVGHDSHGVIRVSFYVNWLREGKVHANRKMQVVFENDCLAVVDGGFGFGQAIGEQAIGLGIEKSKKHGVSIVAIRNCGHLGRIGDWAEMAADAGKISLHWVNTSGLGNLVPPFGGIDRRLSANPIAAGVPYSGGQPIILDISTSSIAEGKIKVAFNKGIQVPPGSIIDHDGNPTTDPKVFYGDPPGAILPFGGHKGYGLGIMAEMLAGALTGGGCTDPKIKQLSNGMLSIILDPSFFATDNDFSSEVKRFVEWVKSSRRIAADGEILLPGEIEQRTRAQRNQAGITLDDLTWQQINDTARSVGLSEAT
ncbi:MAG: malate/lactate/ureidoglycolate dehydrogenase [Pirellulales bacterium]